MREGDQTRSILAYPVFGLLLLLAFSGLGLSRNAGPGPTTVTMEGVRPMLGSLAAGNAQTGTPVYEYLFSFRHDDIVTCGAFSRDGRWLATGSELGTVLITNIESKKEIAIKNPDSLDNGIVGLRFSQDGQFLIVGGYGNQKGGGEIRVLRTSNYSTVMSLDVPGDKVIWYVGLSPDNKWLFSADWGDIWVWNLETRSVAWHAGFEDSAVLFDGGHEVLLAGRSASLGVTDGQIAVLNLVDGKVIRILRTTIKEPIKRLVATSTKNELFVLTDGAIVYRLNNQTGEIKQRLSLAALNPKPGPRPLHIWYTTDFEVLEAHPIFVVSDRQNTLFVNYVSSKVAILDHQSMVGIKFNPSGKNFALLGGVKNGSLVGVPPQHYWTVSLFSFRPF